MKTLAILTALIGTTVLSIQSSTAEETWRGEEPADALAQLEGIEPTLSEVRAQALDHAGLTSRPERGWARRARLAGLMPTVTIRATRGNGWDSDLSRSSSGTERRDEGTDGDLGFEARATWQLDRLVFDDAEIRAAQTSHRLHRVRLQIGAQVTAVYYQRRKLQITQLYEPSEDMSSDALQRADIDELTGQLDTLTGGWFSRQLVERDVR